MTNNNITSENESVADAIKRHEWLHWAYGAFMSRRVGASPYHPAYGLPDDFRMRVIRYADTYGIDAAAQEYNVGVSTIYKWMAAFKKGAK